METPLSLSLDELKARDSGRAAGHLRVRRQRSRPPAAPSAQPAVAHRGRRHRASGAAPRSQPLLDEAGVQPGAVEALLTGLDSGFEGGERQAYERALSARRRRGRPARIRDERRTAAAPARLPAAAGSAGLVRDDQRQVARPRSRSSKSRYAGYQNSVAYRMYDADGEPGEPVTRMLPRSLMVPPGVPDFMTRQRHLDRRPGHADGPRLVRLRADRTRRGLHRRRRELRRRAARRAARRRRLARLAVRLARRARRARGLLTSHRRGRQRAAAVAALEPQGLREQRGGAPRGHGRTRLDCRARAHLLRHPADRPQAPRQLHRGDPQYVEGQDRGDPAIYCIVDLHATSVAYDPAALRELRATTRRRC